MQYTDPQTAFEQAIMLGILSDDQSSQNYAGEFMYMGDNENGQHLFKNCNTRAYLAPVPSHMAVTKFVMFGDR